MLCQPSPTEILKPSSTDDSAPTPSHQGESDNCCESGCVLKLGHVTPTLFCVRSILVLFSWQEGFCRTMEQRLRALVLNQKTVFDAEQAVHLPC